LTLLVAATLIASAGVATPSQATAESAATTTAVQGTAPVKPPTEPPAKPSAQPKGHQSKPLTKDPAPKTAKATATVTSPAGDTLDITSVMISPGHATDQNGRASDCSGPAAPFPGLIAPCGYVQVYDATYTGDAGGTANLPPSTNNQTIQVWDACGNQVMNDYTYGWMNMYLPYYPRFGPKGWTTSGSPLNVTNSMCMGTWSMSYSFTQVFTDGQSLTATVASLFPMNADVPSVAQPAQQWYGGMTAGGTTTHASQADPVDSLTGWFNYKPADGNDLSLAALGMPLTVTRSYSSGSPASGDFGPGWSGNLGEHLTIQTNGDAVYSAGSGSIETFTLTGSGAFTSPPGVLAKLTFDGTQYTIRFKTLIKKVFDASGHLLSVTDRNGQGLSYQYTNGRVSGISGSGRSLAVARDSSSGNITAVTGSDGRSVSYTYDTSGRLASFTDAAGATTAYGYDAGGRLNQITDGNGNYPVRLTYDTATGRAISQLDPLGNKTAFGWTQTDPANAGTGTAIITDPLGNATTDKYVNGYLVDQVDAAGNDTHYSWDANGSILRVVQPDGTATVFTYDASGNLATRSLGYGSGVPAETYQYNANNDLVSTQDFNGNTVAYGYDGNGNLATITRPNVASGSGTVAAVTNTYNPNGTLKSSADANGNVTSYGYNASGDLISQTTPSGRTTTFGRDAAGRQSSVVDPRGNVAGANPDTYRTVYAYDNDDRVTKVTDPMGNATSTAYDKAGNATAVTDPLGHITTTTYDAENRPVAVQGADPTIGASKTAYDADGNVASTTTPGGLTTSYAYDKTNHPTSVTTPAGTWSYTYDANGRLASEKFPSGHTTTYSRTTAGEIGVITYSDGTNTSQASYQYDANGNRTQSRIDNAYVTNYQYNALNKVVGATQGYGKSQLVWSYAYDNNGHQTSATQPGTTAQTMAYDADGRLKSVVSGSTTLATYIYDTTTGTVTLAQPGVATATTFDQSNRPKAITSKVGTTTVASSTYTLDADGNPVQIANADGTTDTYSYDALNRLTKTCYTTTTCSGAANYTAWSYGPDGQRLSQQTPSGTTSYAYNPAGQLTSRSGADGTATYAYDADGNLTGDGTTSYAWNLAGNLTSTTAGATTTSYAYDGLNHRASITKGNSTTTLLTDPITGQLTEEQAANGSTIRQYTYGLAPLGFIASGKAYNYLQDGKGVIRALTDSAGALQYAYTYDPYGKVTKTTSGKNPTANPLIYQANYNDGGSYRMGSREYRPDLGIFLSPDPAQAGGLGYGYGNANPMTVLDPTGNSGDDWIHIVHDIATGVSLVAGGISLVCTAVVICAEVDVVTAPLALVAGAVSWATSDSTRQCFSGKGGCAETVISGGLLVAGGAFGLGGVGSVAEDAGAAGAGLVSSTTAKLAQHVQKAVADYDSGAIAMSASQARAAAANPGLEAAFRGSVIDKAAKAAVQKDQSLSHLWVTGQGSYGPDFADLESGIWWDITTPGQFQQHLNSYSNLGTGIGLFTK
jgi:RHS repeat-associated protein